MNSDLPPWPPPHPYRHGLSRFKHVPAHPLASQCVLLAAVSQRETRSAHQHSLNFGRSLVLNARKHVRISLQRERNTRVTELV
jgi:hypothetical protein